MTSKLVKGLSLSTAIAAAVVCVSFQAPATAAAPAELSANGHGTLLRTDENGRTVRRQFSFSARGQADGTAKGNAVLINPAFEGANGNNYQLHVDISCLQVVGNIAIMGGTTRKTNDPNLVDAVYFTVQDNGEPGKGSDRISSVFFFDDDPTTQGDPQLCVVTGPNDFPFEPIEAGNIQVRGGTTTP